MRLERLSLLSDNTHAAQRIAPAGKLDSLLTCTVALGDFLEHPYKLEVPGDVVFAPLAVDVEHYWPDTVTGRALGVLGDLRRFGVIRRLFVAKPAPCIAAGLYRLVTICSTPEFLHIYKQTMRRKAPVSGLSLPGASLVDFAIGRFMARELGV